MIWDSGSLGHECGAQGHNPTNFTIGPDAPPDTTNLKSEMTTAKP